jgi:hypothetical protein
VASSDAHWQNCNFSACILHILIISDYQNNTSTRKYISSVMATAMRNQPNAMSLSWITVISSSNTAKSQTDAFHCHDISAVYFTVYHYCPQTRRWSLLGMRQMRTREILRWMTSWYYPSWKHPNSALAHHTIVEMFDVFSLCVLTEQSAVAPTNIVQQSPADPRTAPDTPSTTQESSHCLWFLSLTIKRLWEDW